MTLEEKFTGKKPDVSHLGTFGCIALKQNSKGLVMEILP
jgi:hypothetical protein